MTVLKRKREDVSAWRLGGTNNNEKDAAAERRKLDRQRSMVDHRIKLVIFVPAGTRHSVVTLGRQNVGEGVLLLADLDASE